MEGHIFDKLIHNVRSKIKSRREKNNYNDEYAFNTNELKELQKSNSEKIKELKSEKQPPKEEVKEDFKEEIDALEISENKNDSLEEDTKEEEIVQEEKKDSFIHLEEKYQELIMFKWKEIDLNILEKDIVEGKDLLNHNYTITFGDDAARFIHEIRKKYEVVICYLIGFNNEKKGIYKKTLFSDNPDNEWKYLNHYIKLLEKIRNFKITNP